MNRMRYIGFLIFLGFLWSCNNEANTEKETSTETLVDEVKEQSQGKAVETPPILDSLNEVIKQDPYNAMALLERSKVYRSMNNGTYAFADAEAAYAVDSLNPEIMAHWGEMNVLRNSRASRDIWMKCANLYPENIDCREKLAGLYHIVHEFEKSKKMTDEILELDPENATAYFIKGLDYLDGIADTSSALIYFQKAIDLKDDYFEALDKSAIIYTAMKNPLAEAYYKRMLELKPNTFLIYYNMGIYYSNMEEWNKSLEHLAMAQQLQPQNPETYFTIGTVYLKIGEVQDARDSFSKAIATSPSQANYRAHYARGYAFELLGDVTNARKDYNQAITYNPQHEPSRIAIARLNAGDALE